MTKCQPEPIVHNVINVNRKFSKCNEKRNNSGKTRIVHKLFTNTKGLYDINKVLLVIPEIILLERNMVLPEAAFPVHFRFGGL